MKRKIESWNSILIDSFISFDEISSLSPKKMAVLGLCSRYFSLDAELVRLCWYIYIFYDLKSFNRHTLNWWWFSMRSRWMNWSGTRWMESFELNRSPWNEIVIEIAKKKPCPFMNNMITCIEFQLLDSF